MKPSLPLLSLALAVFESCGSDPNLEGEDAGPRDAGAQEACRPFGTLDQTVTWNGKSAGPYSDGWAGRVGLRPGAFGILLFSGPAACSEIPEGERMAIVFAEKPGIESKPLGKNLGPTASFVVERTGTSGEIGADTGTVTISRMDECVEGTFLVDADEGHLEGSFRVEVCP